MNRHPRRSWTRAWVVGAALSLALSPASGITGCAGSDAPRRVEAADGTRPAAKIDPALASRLDADSALPAGPATASRAGDFILSNERVAFYLTPPGRPVGLAPGGSLVDATPLGGSDALESMSTAVGLADGDALRWHTVDPHLARLEGRDDGAAILKVEGSVRGATELRVTTLYVLTPGSRRLELRTSVVNTGDDTRADIAIGDVIRWGRTTPYADTIGTPGEVLTVPDQLWVAGAGDEVEVSYGYMAEAGMSFEAIHDFDNTRTVVARIPLAPGGEWTIVRYLAVGARGDTTSAMAGHWRADGKPLGLLELTVREHAAVEKIGGGVVELVEELGAAVGTIRAGADGRVTAVIPAGSYFASASAAGRASTGEKRITVAAGSRTDATITTTARGSLALTVTEAGGDAPVPARVAVTGVDGTATPMLGPPWSAAGAGNVHFSTGVSTIPLAPGRYTLLITRGPEYDLAEETVNIPTDGTPVRIGVELARLAATDGYIAADLRAPGASGAGTTTAERLLAGAADGLELVALSSVDRVLDVKAALATARLEGQLGAVAAVESPVEEGTLLVLGVPGDSAVPRLENSSLAKAVAAWRVRAPEAVIGLRRPLAVPDVEGIDFLELLHEGGAAERSELLHNWLDALSRGRTPAVVASTGTPRFSGGATCCRRTLIGVGNAVPATPEAARAALDSLRIARNAIVTNGPFVTLLVEGAPPGALVRPSGIAGKKGAKKAKRPKKGKPSVVRVDVTVSAAPWISVTTVDVLAGGETVHSWTVKPRPMPVRLKETISVPVSGDTWLLVVVKGTSPMAPLVAAGASPESVLPFAVTNPVLIDADGDGVFTP